MGDCEDTDFLCKSWTWTHGKVKRKKDFNKNKKCLEHKNNIAMKTDENIQKKKKTTKFKETTEGRKEKKKGKKKKKNRLALEQDDSFIFTYGSSTQIKPTVKLETLNRHSSDKLKPAQDCKKKTKRKKKVVFDLSPGYIHVKSPTLVLSSQQSSKESILFEKEAIMRDSDSSSQVSVTGQSQGQTHANESQCTSEDINSQDLFITQKTFRAFPSEPSSGEASDKAFTTSPQMFTPQIKLHTSMACIKQNLKESYKCQPDSYQHHRKTKKHVQKPKTRHVLLSKEEEEKEWLNKAHLNSKKMELNTNLTEKKKVSCPAHITLSVVDAYLAEPVDINPSMDVAKSNNYFTSSQQSPSYLSDESSVLPPVSMGSTSTQTENFFTTELSFYLNFCQKSRVTVHLEDLKPLDLSLPQRARKDLGMCLSVKTDNSLPGEPSDRHPWSVSTQGKSETTLSPQSECELKSADITISSKEDPPCRTGKLDLTQVRAVQMRLNESFFFKTKGEGQSPRPESPLMKLAQSREVKSRKNH